MIQIRAVIPECVDYLPKEAADFLEAATKQSGGDLTITDALAFAKQGIAEVYLIFTKQELLGAMCIVYGKGIHGKILDVALLGGRRLREWRSEVKDYVIDLAKQRQCRQVIIIGRDGWGKIFPILKPIGTVYALDIQ